MKSLALVTFLAALMLTACVVATGPPGYGVEVIPPLPAIVVLGADPYYYQNGYHYYYHNNNWQYSKSRGGPWTELPRSHWPKEIRHRGRDDDRGRDYRRDQDVR